MKKNYSPAHAFVMNRWQASVWPLNSGVSETITDGGILFKFWMDFSGKLSSYDLVLVIKLLLCPSLIVSGFK